MITINKDLFILLIAFWIFIGGITQIIAGIICNGEPKEYGLWDSLNGLLLVLLVTVCILT